MSTSASVVFDVELDGHHVAAHGVTDFADAVGVLYLPDVTGIFEVVFDYIGVHVGSSHPMSNARLSNSNTWEGDIPGGSGC